MKEIFREMSESCRGTVSQNVRLSTIKAWREFWKGENGPSVWVKTLFLFQLLFQLLTSNQEGTTIIFYLEVGNALVRSGLGHAVLPAFTPQLLKRCCVKSGGLGFVFQNVHNADKDGSFGLAAVN